MKTEINLISPAQKKGIGSKRFFLVSVYLFAFVFLVAAGLIFYRLFLSIDFSNLEIEGKNIIAQIDSQADKKAKLEVIHQKLVDADIIIKRRPDVNSRINAVQNAIPQGVTLDGVDTKDNTLTFSVNSINLSDLNTLIENKIKSVEKINNKSVKRIEMNFFGLDTDKLIYTARFTIEF